MQQVGDILPTVVLPSTVKAIQESINADYTALQTALQQCATNGKFTPAMPQWLAWQSLKSRVLAYLAEEPSWITTKDQVDRGKLLQVELSSWHQQVDQLGCSAGPAPVIDSPGGTLASLFEGTSMGLLVAIGLFLYFSGKK